MNSAFKSTIQFVVILFLTMIVGTTGMVGYGLLLDRETSAGWHVWGLMLFCVIIVMPVAQWWFDAFKKLFNIED